jgi:aldehyde dehydrogenase (NAD+)
MASTALDITGLLTDSTHLIGGKWVAADDGETIDVINPANREVLLRVPRGRAADVDPAVRAAADAFPAWRDTSPTVRGELLRRWGTLCAEHATELDLLEAMEVGRPPLGFAPAAYTAAYVAGQADKVTGHTLPTLDRNTLGLTIREPYGVCGSIIPWNTPGHAMMLDAAPALAAGNTFVLKPAEDAPLACLLMGKLALEAGIPPGVVNIVTGHGTEAGAALPRHPLVGRMSFTGSPETGAEVMRACADTLIPLHLELGGKSPQIVLGDAELAKAVPTIVAGITLNSGQLCGAGSRLLVARSLHAEVVQAIAAAFASIRLGPWHEDNVQMGPLISAKQEKRVLGYLDIGRREGARVVQGGGKPSGASFGDGFFVEPTLFDEVHPDMRIAQEEIFGPVLSVIPFDDVDEAVAIANATKYGLVASLWTNDLSNAVRVARDVQAGQVLVNTLGASNVLGAPFGGYKHSGFGRTMGVETILDYTQVKTVVIDGSRPPR